MENWWPKKHRVCDWSLVRVFDKEGTYNVSFLFDFQFLLVKSPQFTKLGTWGFPRNGTQLKICQAEKLRDFLNFNGLLAGYVRTQNVNSEWLTKDPIGLSTPSTS